MCTTLHLVEFFGLVAIVSQAVRIIDIKVPDTYILETSVNHSESLILDCDYELQLNETGFVLKWLFNDIPIYQWILTQKPAALSIMKGLVNLNYSASSETDYKHKAISITKTSWNLTGEYTCHVQTYQSSDKRSAKLQVIVPERTFQLKWIKVNETGMVNIRCIVENVFPKPKIIIDLNENKVKRKTDVVYITSYKEKIGLYDMSAEWNVKISQISCPAIIRCHLSLPGTNYTRRIESIFYGNLFIDGKNPTIHLQHSII